MLLQFLLVLKLAIADDFTLTTAVMRESTSAKPSTIFRRLNIEAIGYNHTSEPFSFTRARKEPKLGKEVWNWDYWCHHQADPGTCEQSQLRFYYDSAQHQCGEFDYSGCGGNKNRFKTLTECKGYCKDVVFSPPADDTHDFCVLQPDPGYCMSSQRYFYYDVITQSCTTFRYGGCGGNGNRFKTQTQCMKYCSGGK